MSHARFIAVLAGALLAAACSQTQSEVKADAAAGKEAAVAKTAEMKKEVVETKTVEVKKEAAQAKEVELPVREVAAGQKTSLADAIAAALAKTPGEAIQAGLEGEVENGTRSVFIEVMILDAHGDGIEVKVDAATGKVLSSAKETEADEVEEFAALVRKLPSGRLPLAELVKRASVGAEGRMVVAGFAVSKESGVVGVVRFLADNNELHQVTLDPKTGTVLAKKTLKAEEEDDEDEDDEKSEGMEKK